MSLRLIAIAATCAVLIGASVGGADAQSDGTRFTLSGVLVVEGGGRAWLQEPSLTRNEVVSVRLGEEIGPYRLTGIFDDRVELAGPSGKFSVRLAGALGPVTAASPEPSAPVPAPVAAAPAQEQREAVPGRISPQDFASFLQGFPRIQH